MKRIGLIQDTRREGKLLYLFFNSFCLKMVLAIQSHFFIMNRANVCCLFKIVEEREKDAHCTIIICLNISKFTSLNKVLPLYCIHLKHVTKIKFSG